MTIRTQEGRTESIESLRDNILLCPKYNALGDIIHAAIGAMIDVIMNERPEEEIFDKYTKNKGGIFYEHTEAMWALDYLNRRVELSELLYPETNK